MTWMGEKGEGGRGQSMNVLLIPSIAWLASLQKIIVANTTKSPMREYGSPYVCPQGKVEGSWVLCLVSRKTPSHGTNTPHHPGLTWSFSLKREVCGEMVKILNVDMISWQDLRSRRIDMVMTALMSSWMLNQMPADVKLVADEIMSRYVDPLGRPLWKPPVLAIHIRQTDKFVSWTTPFIGKCSMFLQSNLQLFALVQWEVKDSKIEVLPLVYSHYHRLGMCLTTLDLFLPNPMELNVFDENFLESWMTTPSTMFRVNWLLVWVPILCHTNVGKSCTCSLPN